MAGSDHEGSQQPEAGAGVARNPDDDIEAIKSPAGVDATAMEELAAQARALAEAVKAEAGDAEPLPPVGWQAPLVDLLAAVTGRCGLVALIVLIGLGAGIYQMVAARPFYTASSVVLLLPREKPNLDVSVTTGSLETGMDNAKRDTTGALMLPPDPELYMTLLMAKSTLMAVAGKFEARLLRAGEILSDDRSEEISEQIRAMLRITPTQEGMLTVQVTSFDAELAADMANEFAAEMERASKEIERQLILQQSGFLGEAQTRVQRQLAKEEEALRRFFAEHEIVDMASQAGDTLEMIREQEQALLKLEHQLLDRTTYWTEGDAQVKNLRSRARKTRSDIETLRRSYLGSLSQENYGTVQITYAGLRERVKYKRDLLATITTQRAVFDIRAEQPAASVAVLKRAVAAGRPAGPSKRFTLGVPLVLSLIVSVVVVLVMSQWSSSGHDPYLRKRKDQIRQQLSASWLGRALLMPGRILRRLCGDAKVSSA